MSELKICVEVTPTSRYGQDSSIYLWKDIAVALSDAELVLDEADDASVTLKVVKLSAEYLASIDTDE